MSTNTLCGSFATRSSPVGPPAIRIFVINAPLALRALRLDYGWRCPNERWRQNMSRGFRCTECGVSFHPSEGGACDACARPYCGIHLRSYIVDGRLILRCPDHAVAQGTPAKGVAAHGFGGYSRIASSRNNSGHLHAGNPGHLEPTGFERDYSRNVFARDEVVDAPRALVSVVNLKARLNGKLANLYRPQSTGGLASDSIPR